MFVYNRLTSKASIIKANVYSISLEQQRRSEEDTVHASRNTSEKLSLSIHDWTCQILWAATGLPPVQLSLQTCHVTPGASKRRYCCWAHSLANWQ